MRLERRGGGPGRIRGVLQGLDSDGLIFLQGLRNANVLVPVSAEFSSLANRRAGKSTSAVHGGRRLFPAGGGGRGGRDGLITDCRRVGGGWMADKMDRDAGTDYCDAPEGLGIAAFR